MRDIYKRRVSVMKAVKSIALFVALVSMCFFICVGYAAISDKLSISGNAQLEAPDLPDVYITKVSPETSAGVTVSNTNGTVLFTTELSTVRKCR